MALAEIHRSLVQIRLEGLYFFYKEKKILVKPNFFMKIAHKFQREVWRFFVKTSPIEDNLEVRFRDFNDFTSSEFDTYSVYRLFYQEEGVEKASIAQWQSTGLVNQGSRVQSSLEAG